MRLAGLAPQARVSGIAAALHALAGDCGCGCKQCGSQGLNGLSGANAAMVYGKLAQQVREVLNAPLPSATGTRPPDALIFSDSYGYLRQVLNNSDWDGVARWYATQIQTLAKTTTNPTAFWGLSALNVQNYCDRTLTLGDLHAFTEKCILKMCIADYGKKVGFGYAGRKDDLNLAMFFDNGLSKSSGQLNWFTSYANAKAGTRYGACLGWVREPAKHTASNIIVAVGAAFLGAAAWTAISAGAGAASSAATGAAEAGATSAVGSAITAAGTALPAGIEVVTTTASALAPAITAGSVAAGLSAGAVAIAAAPPPLSPPDIPVSEPVIETVTTTASAITAPAAGTVGAGLAAGGIIAAVTPPAITAPDIQVPEPQVLETQEPSTFDTIKDGVVSLVEQLGPDLAGQRLQDWLAQQLGRQPTPQEVEDARNLIVNPDYEPLSVKLKKALPFILLALVLLGALMKMKGKKRVRP